MKNTLMIPLVFITNGVIWILAIAFFSVLGSSHALEILLQGNRLFFLVMVGYRAVYVIPVGIIIALLSVFFYLMRHSSLLFLSIPLIVLITAASVVFIIPKSYGLLAFFENRFSGILETMESRSPDGLFDGTIQTYTGGRWIDLAPREHAQRYIVAAQMSGADAVLSAYSNARYDRQNGSIIADSLAFPINVRSESHFARYLTPPSFLTNIFLDFSRVLEAIRSLYVLNWWVFLTFAGAFYLVVLTLWFLCFASGWRLLNVLFVFGFLRLLIYAYPYAISGPFYQFVMDIRPSFLPSAFVPAAEFAIVASLAIVTGSCVAVARFASRSRRGGYRG